VNVNQTAGVDPAPDLQARRQSLIRQVAERPDLLGEPVPATDVADRHDLPQEQGVRVATGEVAAAAEQQRLVDGRLEVPVRRLRIAVLLRLSGIGPLARHAVVGQQIAVPGLELPRRRQIVHGGGQGIAAVPPRHPAQVPERRLQAVRQRLERLRRTHRHRLPVRVRQHEVVHQVIEPLPGDGDAERAHVGKVGRRQITGLMDLTEHDRLPRPVGGPPLLHPPLERAAV
jgi:hypothetical protein